MDFRRSFTLIPTYVNLDFKTITHLHLVTRTHMKKLKPDTKTSVNQTPIAVFIGLVFTSISTSTSISCSSSIQGLECPMGLLY